MADKFQLKALITGVDKLSPVLNGVRKNAAVLRKQLNSSGLGKITFGEALQGGAIAAPFVMGVKAAIGFESAMADVKKVVNFESPAQFKAMSDDVLNLSERLPMAAEGIAQIVAAGGQSGIAREELNQFAEDAVKMGVAFDQTASESGEMMAKWRTAFRMNQTEVVALADRINYLGNTGPANTKQISAIITEVGALGEVAGLSSAQVAAIGATMAGVGVKQDVAATGIKNFMLAMTKGSAATKSQAEAFKSLRLDSKQVAEAMQKDSQATMLDLLKRISQVDAAKRPALLTNLFGSESVAAITPLVTNLQLLSGNLTKVGDATAYAGSMEAEYKSRSETTANAMQLLQNRVTRLGITVGSMLLPPLNDFMATVGPIISGVTSLAGAHPWLIKGLLGAAVGFTVLRLATAGASAALALMNGVASMSPVGMIVRGIAIAAGVLIANWSTVAPYFQAVWDKIKAPAMAVWEWMKTAFAWSPLGQIVANWEPLTAFFGALWELVKALSVPFFDFLKSVFDWSPLGLIIKHWEPITGFFKGIWDKLRPIIEPMMKFLGFDSESSGDGVISAATAKVNDWAEQQKARNAAGEPVPGALVKPMAQPVQLMPEATSVASLMRAPNQPGPWAAMPLSASQMAEHAQESLAKGLTPQEAAKRAEMGLLSRPGQTSLSAPAPGALAASRGSLVQQAAQASKAQLEGQMVVRFDNAPPGMRVEQADTNQPGLQVSPQVGYRSLGRAS
ncbi:phage tail tape measure protein [Pseudomonas mosselii]|uniref:phage tail tape measure protein n=1 Tax=Pseudomonas mosselii TaxID=78327 RepID=UPI00244CFCB6|nr:phage tail tape measure protein [Pseudomonas mosselii]MDH1656569.1 phage tail tape measure protein [Pseudomonas mosselii]MDH1717993.1 phage tail tape measure protein [Pseudomonas mosselii]MDH1722053.1 phage tail tape measure protein [Pseudomonas mosselii]